MNNVGRVDIQVIAVRKESFGMSDFSSSESPALSATESCEGKYYRLRNLREYSSPLPRSLFRVHGITLILGDLQCRTWI